MTKPLFGLMAYGRDQFGRELGQLADETLLQREADETSDRIDRMRAGTIPATIKQVDEQYERLGAIIAAMDREPTGGLN